jgi:hypothetical protein
MRIHIKFLWLFLVPLILMVGCSVDWDAESESANPHIPLPTHERWDINERNVGLVLALAEERDKWFLESDITEEVVEGLYDSWSVICRKGLKFSDYEFLVYRIVRPALLGSLEIKLEDVQSADRYYEFDSGWGPWVYVKQTWKVDDKVIFGPNYQLYVQEGGKDIGSGWRYIDC